LEYQRGAAAARQVSCSFGKPTVFEQYRWAIIAIATIIPLQSLLIAYVLVSGPPPPHRRG